jgi:hypothetical protein
MSSPILNLKQLQTEQICYTTYNKNTTDIWKTTQVTNQISFQQLIYRKVCKHWVTVVVLMLFRRNSFFFILICLISKVDLITDRFAELEEVSLRSPFFGWCNLS